MGNSADGTIVYGFSLDEDFEGDSPEGHGCYLEDPDIWLARCQGLPEPDGDYDSNQELYGAYWDKRDKLPLELEYSGDSGGGYTMTHVIVKESRLNSGGYGGSYIPVGHVRTPPPEWDVLFREFCEKAGMEFMQPEWKLLGHYG